MSRGPSGARAHSPRSGTGRSRRPRRLARAAAGHGENRRVPAGPLACAGLASPSPRPAPPRVPGGSVDGGRCELRELGPTISSSSATCLVSAATCASSCAIRTSRAARSAALRAGSPSNSAIRSSRQSVPTKPQSPIRARMESAKKRMERYGSLTRGVNGYPTSALSAPSRARACRPRRARGRPPTSDHQRLGSARAPPFPV